MSVNNGIILYAKLSKLPSMHAFVLKQPARLVIDLPRVHPNKHFQQTLKSYIKHKPLPDILSIRYGNFTANTTRLVIDLKKDVLIGNYFVDRGTVVLYLTWGKKGKKSIEYGTKSVVKKSVITTPAIPKAYLVNKKLIILDPGHGGIDPGAESKNGYKEKNFTLKFAKALKKSLERYHQYRVILTRATDTFIPLRQRFEIADKYKATLFISIHANKNKHTRTHGFSIYTFSDTSSDNNAKALAKYENASDSLAGIPIKNYNASISNILLTIKRHKTMKNSTELSKIILRNVKPYTSILRNSHRFAHFVVLESPSVPSILMEVGFLSNYTEERKMQRSKTYLRNMTKGVAKGIHSYLQYILNHA